MKLNKKGFAVSTMLYGVLTIIMVVIAIILSTYRTNVNLEKSLNDSVNIKLNQCAKREVDLQRCYASSTDCQVYYSQYQTCLGKSDQTKGGVGVSWDKFKNFLISNNRVKEIANIGLYVFREQANVQPKNYIIYNGKRGRIVSFTKSGNIKVVFDYHTDWSYNGQSKMPFGTFAGTTAGSPLSYQTCSTIRKTEGWISSLIREHLDKNVLTTFEGQERFARGGFAVGDLYHYNTAENKSNYFVFPDPNNPDPDSTNNAIYIRITGNSENSASQESAVDYESKIGLLNVLDLFYTSSACSLNPGTKVEYRCTAGGWISNSYPGTWLLNSVIIPDSCFQSNFITLPSASSTTFIEARGDNASFNPVVYFDTNIRIDMAGKDGTSAKPYVFN